jgi:hypothetical protein
MEHSHLSLSCPRLSSVGASEPSRRFFAQSLVDAQNDGFGQPQEYVAAFPCARICIEPKDSRLISK